MSAKQAPRLGQGLASLIRDRAPPQQPGAPRAIPLDSLEPSPFQPRVLVDADSLRELAGSIRENGVLQPILVRPAPNDLSRWQIVAGERRWRAAQQAGLHEVPALVRAMTDQQAMAAGLVENLQRTDLDPLEEAEGYQRLIGEFGMTHEALAQAVGKSRSHVGNTLRLLKLPTSVQRDIRSGRLTAGHARALLLHPDPEAAARSVVEMGLNVRQTEQMTQTPGAGASLADGAQTGRLAQSPELADLQRRLSAHLGLRVALTWNGRRGRVAIDVESLDQFEGVVALLEAASDA